MNRPRNERSLLPPRGRRSPTGTARRHSRRRFRARFPSCSSTFLRSLGSRPVTALLRYYGRSDSCPRPRGSARVSSRRPPVRLLRGQVSLIHPLGLPTLPSPTTAASPGRLRTSWRIGPDRLGFPRAGLRSLPAGSPFASAESSSLSYGLAVHPLLSPAALHPVSRRRSCGGFQIDVEYIWRGLSPLRPSALSGAQILRCAQHDRTLFSAACY